MQSKLLHSAGKAGEKATSANDSPVGASASIIFIFTNNTVYIYLLSPHVGVSL